MNLTLLVPGGVSGELRWGDLVVAGDARRRKLRERHGNGLDGVEVREGGRRLLVYFFEHAPRGLHPGNIRIEAPRGAVPSRRSSCTARRGRPGDRGPPDSQLDHPGSAGPYLLRIVERRPDGTPGGGRIVASIRGTPRRASCSTSTRRAADPSGAGGRDRQR